MRTWFKRVILFLVILLTLFMFTGLIVRGIHYVIFRSHTYLSFNSPMLHLTKYCAMGIFVFAIIYRSFTLTDAGKKVIPLLLFLSITGLLVTSLWFNAVNKDEIVKFRVIYPLKYAWEDVDYVASDIYREDKLMTNSRSRKKPRKVIEKYNIHLTNGSMVNVWHDLDSSYDLHQFVLEQNVDIKYLTESEYFYQRFKNYFKDDLTKAEFIFGIEE